MHTDLLRVTDHDKYVAEIAEQVLSEMWERVDTGSISARDQLAIGTAVSKAAQRGFLPGAVNAAHEMGADLQLSNPDGGPIPIRDPWLETYSAED